MRRPERSRRRARRVDGGMVAQAVAVQAPELLDRLILAGSGPAGGPGLVDMTRVTAAAVLTFNDPKTLLFFTRTPAGKTAARQYPARLEERASAHDKSLTPRAYRVQLAAMHRWGCRRPLTFRRSPPQSSSSTATATGWCRRGMPWRWPGSCRLRR